MEIRNRSTGELTTVSQFKSLYPTTSFPKQITVEVLDSYGYDPLLQGPQASVTAPYEISVRNGVEQVNDQWFTKYAVGPTFTDTTDEDGNVTSAADNEAAYRAGIDASAAETVRSSRNSRLAESDWTQLADQPFAAADQTAWAGYRQALRDLPTSEGFPHEITWPEEPS